MSRCDVSIAGIDLGFTYRGAALDAWLSRRFGSFRRARSARAPVRIDLAMTGSRLEPRVDGEPMHLAEQADGELLLTGARCSAQISGDGRRALIRGASSAQPVDTVVRLILARRLLDVGALLLHASAIVTPGGEGIVFAGPSGAGKSTLARTLGGHRLSDEAVVIGRENGHLVVHATPYWHGRPHLAPLTALLFVGLAPEPRWEDLSGARAGAALFGLAGPVPPSARARALDIASDLAQECRTRALVRMANHDQIHGWLEPRLEEALRGA